MSDIVERCTCMEVLGEDPNCARHGVETPWALENTLPSEWQNTVIELRAIIAKMERGDG